MRNLFSYKFLFFILLLGVFFPLVAQQDQDAILYINEQGDTIVYDSQQQQELMNNLHVRNATRKPIDAQLSWMAGPSYSPENSFGLGGAFMLSFRPDKNDQQSFRSTFPLAIYATWRKSFMVAGGLHLFLNENKIRFDIDFDFRQDYTHYYGKGIAQADTICRSDSTTRYRRLRMGGQPTFMYGVAPHVYLGVTSDFTYVKADNFAERMYHDPYFQKFSKSYRLFGHGIVLQCDTRDNVQSSHRGFLLAATAKIYGKYTGGTYDYVVFDVDYRHYVRVFRSRSTLAWALRTQMTMGDVPYSELPSLGMYGDFRGFYADKYCDKSVGYGQLEYRYMFGSETDYYQNKFYTKLGLAVWVGAGSVGADITQWKRWKVNFGGGVRYVITSSKMFRFDVAKGLGERNVMFYVGMTESF